MELDLDFLFQGIVLLCDPVVAHERSRIWIRDTQKTLTGSHCLATESSITVKDVTKTSKVKWRLLFIIKTLRKEGLQVFLTQSVHTSIPHSKGLNGKEDPERETNPSITPSPQGCKWSWGLGGEERWTILNRS